MTALNSVQSTINEAWDLANSAMTQAKQYTDQAVSASQGTIFIGTVHNPDEPDAINVTPPDLADLETLLANAYSGDLASLKQQMDNMLEDFLDKYFPDYTAKLKTISDWLDNTIKNGGTGIPPAIEQAIFDRAKGRGDALAIQAEDSAFRAYAQRGYPLPPGILTEKIDAIHQENQNELNRTNREIMIKQAELEVEQIRFAIDQGVRLHIGMLNAGQAYMGSIVALAGQGLAYARALIDAILGLYQITHAYVRAAVDAEELGLRYDQIKINRDLSVNQLDVNAFQAKIDARVNAALAAAKSMGDQAAAAVGSQNTLATIAHETLASG